MQADKFDMDVFIHKNRRLLFGIYPHSSSGKNTGRPYFTTRLWLVSTELLLNLKLTSMFFVLGDALV